MGIQITKFIDNNQTKSHHNPINATFNNIDQEDILPNNLIDREIIFENIPTISRNHTNKDITISHILAQILLPSNNHFPVIGTYSWTKFLNQRFLYCNIRGISVAINAKARVVSNSALGAVTRLNIWGNINLIISIKTQKRFEIKTMKKRETT